MPTWLVKCHSDIFAPVVTDICNASFQQVKFPQCCKTAIIRPRLKQRTLDPNDLGSYRPISNLGFLSKVVEKVVDARLAEHVNRHRLLPIVQSAFRPFHLTDMQGFRSGDPSDISVIVTGVEDCVSDVSSWSAAKQLQLNATKTEILWFGSETKLRKLSPENRVISVGQSVIQPVTVVRDLGVLIDGELSMRQHVTRLAQTCFFHLRRLRSLRRQLGRDVMARLVSALVLSRLDYCNAVLTGLPASTLAPLQRVLHAAARVVMDLRPRDHVSSALRELHWLPIKQRIEFKLCLLVHKSLIGHSPAYISDLLTSAADVPGRPALRTASRGDFIVPRTNRKFGDRAFCVAAPRVWNRLPADLRQLRSTQTFRRHLKTFLFAASY